MADIVVKKPETKRSALIKGDELHMTETTGPHQLTMVPGEPAIGQRHTTTLDIIKMADMDKFMSHIRQQIDDLKEGLVKQKEQKVGLENIGVEDVGPKLDEFIKAAKAAANGSNKKNAWTSFQRKLFKEKAITSTFNNWQAYKQLKAQMELNGKRLTSAEETFAMLEETLAKDGKASP